MLWLRVLRFGTRLAVGVFAIAIVFVLSLRAYDEYEVHHATGMLAEASRVQVGDPEATVLPLVSRYGGFKRMPDPLGRKEDWIDKDEYQYQKNLVIAYGYASLISPYGLFSRDTGSGESRVAVAVRAVMNKTPVQLRSVFGMRDWGVEVDMAIRSGRVQSVSGMVVVEGRSRWLGHEWEFATAMPRHELQARDFVVNSAMLDMATNNGDTTENYFTPRASDEEMQLSRKFNTACLTSLRGCDGLCAFVPRTLAYLKRHPESAGNIIQLKCPE